MSNEKRKLNTKGDIICCDEVLEIIGEFYGVYEGDLYMVHDEETATLYVEYDPKPVRL